MSNTIKILIIVVVLTLIGFVAVKLFTPASQSIDGKSEISVATSSSQEDIKVTSSEIETDNKSDARVQISDVKGITFEIYKDWSAAEIKYPEYGNGRGLTFGSSDYSPRTEGFNYPNDNNDIKEGARFSIGFTKEDVAETLEEPNAYIDFYKSMFGDCSNCIVEEVRQVDGVPAVFQVSTRADYGGSARYHLFKNGEIFTVTLSYTDNYPDHVEQLNSIVKSIKFTN